MLNAMLRSLPAQVFFNPTESCLIWITKYIGSKSAIDCGSGIGRLSAGLTRKGIQVVAIDICSRDAVEVPPIPIDAVDYPYSRGTVAIIARPCRGEWIHGVIDKVIDREGKVLYIGLEKHYEIDLEPLEEKYCLEKQFENAGDDGEYIYSIKSKEGGKKKMKTYCLLYDELGNSWWMSDGDEWRNSAGGWCPKRKDDVVLETVEAENFDDLDWTKSYLLKPDSDTGWLDRSGKFYGCSHMDHDACAIYVIRKEVEELENKGWVRIILGNDFYCLKRLSAEQRNFLSAKGHIIKQDD